MPRPSPAGLGLALLAALWLAGCSSSPEDEAPLPVGDFSLTERSGRTVTRDDLRGKVWVASFIFTRCGSDCPKVTTSMARLQKELAGRKDVLLVSFSVDPEHDGCPILQDYAKDFAADPERWLFLTGKQDELYRLIEESFRLAVRQNEGETRTPGNEVTHSSKLVLVDRRGHIRGYFEGAPTSGRAEDVERYEQSLKKLRDQITTLLREKP